MTSRSLLLLWQRIAPLCDAVGRSGLLPLATALLGAAVQAAPASLTVERVEAVVHVQASATLQADTRTVWDTLVGYEQLPGFIPDMAASRTLQRDGDDAVVQQSGRAGIGPFKQGFSLTLAVHEVPLQTITAHALAGDFSRFESSYRLCPGATGGTRIEYSALIEPKAGIAPLLGVPAMRQTIGRQFDALLAEIERRAAAAPSRP